jgi:murein DD-endopeptidase MepM/ murein hydrolase activator NlpD
MMTRRAPTKKYHGVAIGREPDHPIVAGFARLSILAGILVFLGSLLGMEAPLLAQDVTATLPHVTQYDRSNESSHAGVIPLIESPYLPEDEIYETTENNTLNTTHLSEHPTEQLNDLDWQEIQVTKGDSLARIFKRLRLSQQDLHTIMTLGKETSVLKHLKPGQIVWLQVVENQFVALKYPVDLLTTLQVVKNDDGIHATTITEELETRVKHATVTIKGSLFLSGVAAGLSENLVMQLVAIYGWDIDFALDIRSGDRFSMIYEEYFKNGVKVREGPITAAEFVNRGTLYRAIRFTHEDGHSEYYSDTGRSMRKAFLRTPVKFTRISSRFSLKRKHPILNTLHAHRGVDYAAPSRTPVKATGAGTVTYLGRKGGLGNAIILKHGGRYDTVYAHLSSYKKGLRTGQRVKQGQIIGYVGMTGLATGPHLHYEFRVNGVHRNPLTVEVPKANGIPAQTTKEFMAQIEPLLAELDSIQASTGTTTRSPHTNSNDSVATIQDNTDVTTLE